MRNPIRKAWRKKGEERAGVRASGGSRSGEKAKVERRGFANSLTRCSSRTWTPTVDNGGSEYISIDFAISFVRNRMANLFCLILTTLFYGSFSARELAASLTPSVERFAIRSRAK